MRREKEVQGRADCCGETKNPREGETMSSDAEEVLDLVAHKLRKKKGLCPPTPEEAAEAFKKAKAIPLTDEEHASIVDAMLSGQTPERDFDEPQPWCGA